MQLQREQTWRCHMKQRLSYINPWDFAGSEKKKDTDFNHSQPPPVRYQARILTAIMKYNLYAVHLLQRAVSSLRKQQFERVVRQLTSVGTSGTILVDHFLNYKHCS